MSNEEQDKLVERVRWLVRGHLIRAGAVIRWSGKRPNRLLTVFKLEREAGLTIQEAWAVVREAEARNAAESLLHARELLLNGWTKLMIVRLMVERGHFDRTLAREIINLAKRLL